MSYEISSYTLKVTRIAGADLSTTGQYLFVKKGTNAGEVVVCSAATDVPIGVLQNSPRSGEEAEVLIVGGTKLKASAAISEDVIVGTDTAGKAAALTIGTDTTKYCAGRLLQAAGGANELVFAVIDCAVPGRAA